MEAGLAVCAIVYSSQASICVCAHEPVDSDSDTPCLHSSAYKSHQTMPLILVSF